MKLELGQPVHDAAELELSLRVRDATHLESRGPEVDIALWTLTAVSCLFLSLRLYCKSYKHKDLWWDDWILILSWILLLANSIVTTLSVSLGFGRHLLDIAFSNREELLLLGSLSTTFSTLSAVWSKTSFGLTLLRLTQVGYEKTRIFVWFIMISMNLLMVCDALYSWVECQPSRKHWEIFTDGTCWSPDVAVKFGIAAGAYSGCMDVFMAILPWRIIWETRMERKEKFGVLVAMSMGLCAGAAAFAKCSQIPQISLFDETYTGVSLVILGAVEPAITIVGASIPALRVLLADFKHFTQRRDSDQSESQGSNFDFWDDGSRQSRRSLFKWDIFGSSKSVEHTNATGTTSTVSCSDTTTLAPPVGLAANFWIFPTPTRPAPSHNYPNLSQQLEDFLWSRKNSYAANKDYKPGAIKQRFLSVNPRFTKASKVGSKDDSDRDNWSLSSIMEDGNGCKGPLVLHGRAPGQFVVVQTTEITVEFE
ncbi:hypothetical protein LA080_009624 [Diaporthe eres]|nr:hypothetical protein LA080_009624 [Diaporthe eres]